MAFDFRFEREYEYFTVQVLSPGIADCDAVNENLTAAFSIPVCVAFFRKHFHFLRQPPPQRGPSDLAAAQRRLGTAAGGPPPKRRRPQKFKNSENFKAPKYSCAKLVRNRSENDENRCESSETVKIAFSISVLPNVVQGTITCLNKYIS